MDRNRFMMVSLLILVFFLASEPVYALVGFYFNDHRFSPHRVQYKIENGLGRDMTIYHLEVVETSQSPRSSPESSRASRCITSR